MRIDRLKLNNKENIWLLVDSSTGLPVDIPLLNTHSQLIGLAANTIKRHLSSLSLFYRYCFEHKRLNLDEQIEIETNS